MPQLQQKKATMTTEQSRAIGSLASRYNVTLDDLDICPSPFDLPEGWVSVLVLDPKDRNKCRLVCGVSPEGNIHS